MIKKTFIVFVIMFFGLNLWLSHWKGMDSVEHAGVYVRNNIRHEKFIFSEERFDTILIGSSMSSRLNLDVLFAKSLNLTSEGGSFTSGLFYIKNKKMLPSVILLELNSFVRFEADIITQPYELPLINSLRAKLPLLQSKNRLGCNAIYNSLPIFDKILLYLPQKIVRTTVNKEVNNSLPVSNIPKKLFEANINIFDDFIAFSKENKIKIILFEMPFKEGIQDPLFKKARELARLYALKSNIDYIESGGLKDILFTDRVHISTESAESFSFWLKDRIKK